jgi:hypothetical protein
MGQTLLVLVFLMATSAFHHEAWAQAEPQVSFSGDLGVGGSITTGAGIEFPDGTVQMTAAGPAVSGITANAGLYGNQIVDFSPPLPYVEVCFLDGGIEFDIHVNGGDSTEGGDCTPGDRGWVIEREARAATYWEEARAECLLSEMRLLEPFEFLVSCRRAQSLGLIGMTGGWEWVGNEAHLLTPDAIHGLAAGIVGFAGCDHAEKGWIARSDQVDGSAVVQFRCGR